LLAIGQLQQHRSVTKLVQRAPARKIFSAQRLKKIGLRCEALCKVGSKSSYSGFAVQLRTDPIRIAKRRRPVDLDVFGGNRHPLVRFNWIRTGIAASSLHRIPGLQKLIDRHQFHLLVESREHTLHHRSMSG
jgi:hypothetical protein